MVHELVREIVRTRQQGGYADLENKSAIGDSFHDISVNHISPPVTMGYVKSPTPAAPMEMACGEDGAMKEGRCCCTIM